MDLFADFKEFEALLDKELKKAGEQIDKDSDASPQAAGASFEYLIASWFIAAEPDFEQKTPDDANVGSWGGSKDLQCDLWFEDGNENKKVIVDTKWRSKTLKVTDYSPFFGAWKLHIDPVAREHGNDSIQRKLENFEDFMSDQANCVEYRLVSNQKLALAGQKALAKANKELEQQFGPDTKHKIVVIDRYELYQYYREANSVLLDLPPELEISIAGRPSIEITDPLRCVVVAIPGKVLADLYYKYGRGLFSHNIRSYIGPGKINNKVKASARDKPELFFYRNNGISALCTNLKVGESSIQVDEFQIVNGAQTVGTLHKANVEEGAAKGSGGLSDRLLVLARIVEIDAADLKSESADSITRSIILANNTQNAITIQDRESNQPLQRFLEHNFVNKVENALFKPYRYVPKRSADTHSMGVDIEKPSGAEEIKMKPFAKLRYAYLSDNPMMTQGGQANALSTPLSEKDYQKYVERIKKVKSGDDANIDIPPYVRAFGVDGRLPEIWGPDTLRQAQFAYAVERYVKFYGKYLTELDKMEKEKNKEYKPLYSCYPIFYYHVIAMYGAWLRESKTEDWAIALLDKPNQCKAVFEKILGDCAMVKVYETYNGLLDDRKQQDSIRVESAPYTRMRGNFFAECQRKWSDPNDLLGDSDS